MSVDALQCRFAQNHRLLDRFAQRGSLSWRAVHTTQGRSIRVESLPAEARPAAQRIVDKDYPDGRIADYWWPVADAGGPGVAGDACFRHQSAMGLGQPYCAHPPSIAPLCAQPSIPLASPLITWTPQEANSFANS